ncbi:MAG: MerR family transcriptional regulator [Gemmatimonadales bacterium]|nr:MerR family transcriptional regulator [Gemmatimonadales bacterium]
MESSHSSIPRHPVRFTALRTGLSPHVLRAWERRYGVVSPSRTGGGQRLYSDLDVERLKLLRRLTERGHSIGRLADSSLADLERTAREENLPRLREAKEPPSDAGAEEFRQAVLGAIRNLDGSELQTVLERAAVTLGVPLFLDRVAGPSLQEIGQGWSEGTVSIAQEHLASAVFRRVLGWILQVYEARDGAPRLLGATPPRHVHELGALLAAGAAAAEGWDVTYLGPDLPIAELLGAARHVGASAVALSVVYPKVDAGLIIDLEQLRSGLDTQTTILLGGAAAIEDRERLTALGAQVVDSLGELRTTLQRLRERT